MCVMSLCWDALQLRRCGRMPVGFSYCHRLNPSGWEHVFSEVGTSTLSVIYWNSHAYALWEYKKVNISKMARTHLSLAFVSVDINLSIFLSLMCAKLQDWAVIAFKTCWQLYMCVSWDSKAQLVLLLGNCFHLFSFVQKMQSYTILWFCSFR